MTPSENASPWSPSEVVHRVERARGAYLARTGVELRWADIGRHMGWKSSATASEVKDGTRPLRVEEIGELSQLLGCSPAWLAFGEAYAAELPTRREAPPLRAPSAADRAREQLLAGDPAERPAKRRSR